MNPTKSAVYKEKKIRPPRHVLLSPYTQFVIQRSSKSVVAVDNTGIINIFNKQAEVVFNLRAEDVLGRPFMCIFSHIPEHEHYLLEVLRTGREWKDKEYSYCPYTDKEGVFIHNIALVYENGLKIGAIWMRKDQTTERRFQTEINNVEVQAMVSQIAAGMAHEIRNPLTTARGYIQLSQQLVVKDNPVYDYLEMAIEEVNQINRIITDFLALVHPGVEGLQLLSLNQLIDEVLQLLENVATMYNISVEKKLDVQVPLCMLDAKQVRHAILNVLRNAIQSMPEGGRLGVTTVYLNEKEEISVSISDTGVGIPKENLSRIFNPFYSTKIEGSGLGLTLTKRIIEHHDGHIRVDSVIGWGTVVQLSFPVRQKTCQA